MSETNETEGKSGGRKMTLNLRRTVESGHVRQSFSHGRSKSVLVEKKKRRSIGSGGAAAAAEDVKEKPRAKAPAKEEAPKPAASKPRRSGVVLKQLSEEEKGARAKALADARVREAEERERAKEDAAKEAALAEQRAKEAAEEEARRQEDEAKKAAEAQLEATAKPKAKAAPKSLESPRRPMEPEKEQPRRQADARHKKGTAAPRRGEERRVRGRLTITNALDEEQRQRSLASLKRHRERQKKQGAGPQAGQKIAREVTIPDVITIQELANRMA